MRILSVCSNFRVFGAETITLKMIEGFKQNGHEQLAVTSIWTDGEFSRRLNAIGVPEIQLALGALTKKISLRTGWWMINTLARLPGAWVRWARVLRQFRPDVIVFTNSKQCLLLYPWLKSQTSVLVQHALMEPSNANRNAYQILLKRVSRVVAVSNFLAAGVQRWGVPKERVSVVRNGPFSTEDMANAKQGLRSRGVRSECRKIGIVGQVSAGKGHDCLIEAFRLLRCNGIDSEVHVYGSGDPAYLAALRDKLTAYGLADRWYWRGYEGNISRIYTNLDVLAMPSRCEEAFGMVAAEASAYGLPVVVSNRGALPEIVTDKVTGFLVDPENYQDLADRIQCCISNPAVAAQMGKAGHERMCTEFTREKMVGDFEQLFRQLKTQNSDAGPLVSTEFANP